MSKRDGRLRPKGVACPPKAWQIASSKRTYPTKMNTEPNPLNIPAYQRKRSIAAQARKKPAYLETALDRARSALKNSKKTRKKTKSNNQISKRRTSKPYPTYQKSPTYSSPVFAEIPIQTPLLPSQQIFPNPFDDMAAPKKSAFREMKICGVCEGYFDKIEVAIVKVTSPIRVGDSIIFEKHEGLFEQEVKSMQIDRKDITLATTGSEIGLKVHQKPTVGAPVYKVVE